MLVNMKKMLNEAKDHSYAVAHFNINNLEWAKFILEKCNELNSPVILGVSEGAIKYMGGFKVVGDMVKAMDISLNISVPVALHLDHGSSVLKCKEAIDNGFTSVMIDASNYPIDENIEIVKQVMMYASKYNVSVEAEVGLIGGEEDGIANETKYAKVDDCIKLVLNTNVDFLAPALGSVHGLYKGEPKLNFERMLEISKKTNVPLVLHGGTGIDDEKIKQAVKNGICKVNINTELQIVWSKAVRTFLKNDLDVYDPRKIIKAGEASIKESVYEKIKLLGSLGKHQL